MNCITLVSMYIFSPLIIDQDSRDALAIIESSRKQTNQTFFFSTKVFCQHTLSHLQDLFTFLTLGHYSSDKLKLTFYYQKAKPIAFSQPSILPHRFHRVTASTIIKALSRPVVFKVVFMISHLRHLDQGLMYRKSFS